MSSVRVRSEVLAAIMAHARRDVPLECCGLLLVRNGVIDEAMPARNLRQSPATFEVDPADHFAALRKARSSARSVRGVYHSHPRGPSVPSATDRKEMNDPSLLYLIVSLAEPAGVYAFRWQDGNFVPVDLVPVP